MFFPGLGEGRAAAAMSERRQPHKLYDGMFSLGLGEGRATAASLERRQTHKLYDGGAAKRR